MSKIYMKLETLEDIVSEITITTGRTIKAQILTHVLDETVSNTTLNFNLHDKALKEITDLAVEVAESKAITAHMDHIDSRKSEVNGLIEHLEWKALTKWK